MAIKILATCAVVSILFDLHEMLGKPVILSFKVSEVGMDTNFQCSNKIHFTGLKEISVRRPWQVLVVITVAIAEL